MDNRIDVMNGKLSKSEYNLTVVPQQTEQN